jgi:hypothetical protein
MISSNAFSSVERLPGYATNARRSQGLPDVCKPNPTSPWSQSHSERLNSSGTQVAVAILLTISALADPNLLAAVNRATIAKAIADIHSISTDIQAYERTKGVFPNTLADIGYDKFNDPWHNPYQYLNFANTKGKGKMRKDRFLVPINTFS